MSEIQQTHSEECWRWHGHEKCAQRKVESLLAEYSELHAAARALVDALDDERVDDLTHLYERLDAASTRQ